MHYAPSTVAHRVRAALIAGSAALLVGTTLAGTALADQAPTTPTSSTSTSQTPQAIGLHTHQLHGTVKTAPSAGATTFVVTTERYGDVTVSFAGTTVKGHGHGRGEARAFPVTAASELKAGERVIALGSTSADGKSFVARRVHALPAAGDAAHPTHLVGTIASVSTSNGTTTLSLNLADGSTQTVTLSGDAKIRPEGKTAADLTAGTKVTVVSKNGTATGVVVLPA